MITFLYVSNHGAFILNLLSFVLFYFISFLYFSYPGEVYVDIVLNFFRILLDLLIFFGVLFSLFPSSQSHITLVLIIPSIPGYLFFSPLSCQVSPDLSSSGGVSIHTLVTGLPDIPDSLNRITRITPLLWSRLPLPFIIYYLL